MDNDLRSIVNRQKNVLADLETAVLSIENSDVIKENQKLKADLEKLNQAHIQLQNNLKNLYEQNLGLKNALYEQIYNEKTKLINNSREKIQTYFKSNVENESNKLYALENNIKYNIDKMSADLLRNKVDINDEIFTNLNELSRQVNIKVTQAQKQLAESYGVFSQNANAEYENLKNQQITDEQVIAVTKKNNLERFVGLNLLNGLGILLIIIGTVTAARYTFIQLPDLLKVILMFSVGGIMLGVGELMNRKKPNIFSLGITAGGVGVLYVSLATSYFILGVLSMYAALILCVLMTAVTFFLSTRYNSQIILVLALIGGYMPMFSLSDSIIFSAMVYFAVLNLLALLISFKKKWYVSTFVGLGLNIVTVLVILSSAGTMISNYAQNSPNMALLCKIIILLYAFFVFVNYTLIPIVSTYKSKVAFNKYDVILLSLNTVFSSLILYFMFYLFKWNNLLGVLAIVFAAIYLYLGGLIERKFKAEKRTQELFYLTGLAFVVLVVPLQFGRVWLSLGWLIEGVVLTVYGILKDEKNFKYAGFIICGFCISAFLMFDIRFEYNYFYDYDIFAYKYLAITLGSLAILGTLMYKRTLAALWQRIYKYCAIVNLWFYCIYATVKLNSTLFRLYGQDTSYNFFYLSFALITVVTFMIAYFTPRITILCDFGTKIISIVLYGMGILFLFFINTVTGPVQMFTSVPTTIIGTLILVILGLLSVFAVRDLMKIVVMEKHLGVEWYPLVVSAYFVVLLTHNLIRQYGLYFSSTWISIIFALNALGWIIFGFAKRYSFIRLFGLGLSLLTVIKVFIIDFASLTRGYLIISYLSLGVILVAISFVYQYFNKRLELKMEVKDDVSQDN